MHQGLLCAAGANVRFLRTGPQSAGSDSRVCLLRHDAAGLTGVATVTL